MYANITRVSWREYCNRWYDKASLMNFLPVRILMTAFDGTFWVDIDFSALSESTFEKVCNVLNLHETTMRDCLIEDKSVTDTKISQLEDYLFCIVDTLQMPMVAQKLRIGRRKI